MYEISNRAPLPYSSICYLQCEWPDGTATRASGIVVGTNDVLTADHAIFDAARGGYATKIMVVPGADTSPAFQAPFGSYTDVAVIFSRAPNWDADGDQMLTAQESQSDLALLGLRTPVGNITGWTQVAPYAADFNGTMDGYPARGTGLMEERVYAAASPSWSVYDIASSLGPGASGGPLLRTDSAGTTVTGVLSSGNTDPNDPHSTYAGLFGSNWQWIQDAIRADDGVMAGVQVPASSTFAGAAQGVVTYMGTIFADSFRGTSLSENYLGRGGADTVTFSGARTEYRLWHSGADVVVNDTLGRDGSDTLASITHANFGDFTVNLRVGADSRGISGWDLKMLESLYVGFFDRIPEADGLDYWINQVRAGHSVTQVADNFYSAALQYPTLTGYSPRMTSAEFVDTVYRNALGRTDGADQEGLNYWVDQLADGTSRGFLVERILQTAMSFKGDATWGWVADLLDNKAAVAQHFAVEMGLSYLSPADSISHGMQMADAVTPTSTAEAVALIGVSDTFSTLG